MTETRTRTFEKNGETIEVTSYNVNGCWLGQTEYFTTQKFESCPIDAPIDRFGHRRWGFPEWASIVGGEDG